MDISKMTVTELQALGYRTRKLIDQEQANLNVIEERIRFLNVEAAKAMEAEAAKQAAAPTADSPEPTAENAQPNGDQPTQPGQEAGTDNGDQPKE